MDALQHTVDGDMARRFLDFLDPITMRFCSPPAMTTKSAPEKPARTVRPHGSTTGTAASLSLPRSTSSKPRPGASSTVQRMRGKRRLAKNVCVIRAVFHEWDTAAPPPSFELPPSLVVETSTVVGANGDIFSKLRHYWLIDPEHPISAEDFHCVMECMVETHGSDPDAKDLARVLRLPGSWHQKANPHQVRIVGGCVVGLHCNPRP